jgi:hypothetical protein
VAIPRPRPRLAPTTSVVLPDRSLVELMVTVSLASRLG